MAREYFCAYHSYRKAIEPLTDAERGRLWTALLEYSETGAEPDLRGGERYVFPLIKSQIDRDSKKYEETCEKNRQNGCKGGQANAKRSVAVGSERPPNAPQRERKEEGEEEGYYNTPLPPEGEDERFLEFWNAYPKKVGKAAAARLHAKLRPSGELHRRMLAAIVKQNQSEQWQKHGGQFIPNPATWLNQGRWEDEVQTCGIAQSSLKKAVVEQQYNQRAYDPAKYTGFTPEEIEEIKNLQQEHTSHESSTIHNS